MGRNDIWSKEPRKSEKPLKSGSVVLKTIANKVNIDKTIYCWRIFNYQDLKPNVIYIKEFNIAEVECALKMYKAENSFYLCLQCDQLVHKTAQFYLMSEKQTTSLKLKALEFSDGFYWADFKYKLFEGPELPYLLDGTLTISFQYVSDRVNDASECQFDGMDVLSNLDELCCDLKRMYLESMYPDFEIKVKGYVLKAHKFILSSRCGFFEEYFDKNPGAREITLDDAPPGILHEVLLYVYCGELMDMDLPFMVKVLDLADYLQIVSLAEKCNEYFNSHVDERNVDEFQEIIKDKRNPELDELLKKFRTKMAAS